MVLSQIICFDVFGTLFSYDVAVEAIKEHLGAVLEERKLDEKLFFYSWFYTAQRDFSYASQGDHYVPFSTVIESTLFRALLIAGLARDEVEKLAPSLKAVTDAFKKLTPRPGVKEAFEYLDSKSWTTFAVTNGAHATTKSLFSNAGVKFPDDRIISCDDIKAAKADKRVYAHALKQARRIGILENGYGKEGDCVFVASHTWDLCAAKSGGWKTGWVSYEEIIPCDDVFGKPDWEAEGLADLLKRIVEE